ncbi:MAG: glutamyl-tRNA amidotransferase [Omnitrophica bacterium RBG_13_46_9]|nr:MAG: glutamyl-tRNA amidotransferase [Omnitrophica bacterium RBG_13_46_9]
MSFEEMIEKDFKSSLKERNQTKVSTLRMLKAEIQNVRFEQGKTALTDDDIIKVIRRQIKQHQDSIEQFEKGRREDLVQKEKEELAILTGYMPRQLSHEELTAIINETISELGASGKKDMGKVIKSVMEKVKGKAEGKKISQIVSGILK